MRLYAGHGEAMRTPLRGSPSLNIPLEEILEAVRATGNQTNAATKLGCSEASVRTQINLAGLTLKQVMAAEDVEALLALPSEFRANQVSGDGIN